MPTDPAVLSAVKKLFFEQALTFGDVGVRFIADAPGVEIPDFLEQSPGTVQTFIYSIDQPTPIPDLDVGDAGIRATLSFGRQLHATSVPWVAVVAMGGVEFGIVFPVPAGKLAESPAAAKGAAQPGLKLVR